MMKKVIFLFSIISLLFSCNDDFLDRAPYDSMSSSNIWVSDANAVMAVNGIYAALNKGDNLNGIGGCFSNFTRLGPDGTYYTAGAIETGKSSDREALYLAYYTGFYQVIFYANTAIANLQANNKITKSLADRLIGEAKFLRGWSYFYLWQLFGGVVILDKPVLASETYLPRNTTDEVKALVISDFTDASQKLPVSYTGNDYGRVTQGAAIAMLGKTYLYDKQWGKAANEFSKLMTSPFRYELHPDYSQLFDWKWEKNNECIFGMQYVMEPALGSDYDKIYGFRSASGSGWDVEHASYILVSSYTLPDGSPIDMSTMPKRSNYASEYLYGLALIPWYQTTFANVDKRLHANAIMPGFRFIGFNNVEFMVNWPFNDHVNDKPYKALQGSWTSVALVPFRKFVNVGNETTLLWDSPNDFPAIRYADILLMYAEAKNEESGVSQDVYNAVNLVRTRAGLANLPAGLTKDQMRRNIWLERLKEFPGEGISFFDVKRWKTAATTDPVFGLNHDELDFRGIKFYTKVFTERDYLWPIPGQERDLNPKLDQNPGW
jgi:starch-binding outer membrane protein, SusD/RagB family